MYVEFVGAKGYVLGTRTIVDLATIVELVDQANTIPRNSWMTELKIEELERKVTGSDSVIVEEARSDEALPDQVGEDVRNVLLEMGAKEQADSLDEEEVAIAIEIAEVIEKGRKYKLPALRTVPKKKL